MFSTNAFQANVCDDFNYEIGITKLQLRSRNYEIGITQFQLRSRNYEIGITQFQLRSRNKIFDFQSFMPKPTLQPRTLIFLKHRIHRRSVNEPFIELRASNVIECSHVARVGRFIITVEMLVNETKLF